MRRVFYAYLPPIASTPRSGWVRPRLRSVLLLAARDALEYSENVVFPVFVMGESEIQPPMVLDAYMMGKSLGRSKAQERYAALVEQGETNNARH